MESVIVAGEMIAAATALAGLILVYLGSLGSSFDTFETAEKNSVRAKYQRKAWIAFVGLFLALLAALLALLGKWLPSECIADVAICVLLVAFGWGGGIGLLTVLEVK